MCNKWQTMTAVNWQRLKSSKDDTCLEHLSNGASTEEQVHLLSSGSGQRLREPDRWRESPQWLLSEMSKDRTPPHV